MAYTSLFKKDDVRVTQAFSSTHKGLDLSRGVVEQPIYLPNKAISGYVWKILPGYTSGGIYYADAPIIYVKHPNGSGSRYIHSYPRNVKVKVGDNIVAGQQICSTGNSGHSFGDHLHFEWLTKWDDLNTRVDPAPYVINDSGDVFQMGDRIEFTGIQNIRSGAGDKFPSARQTMVGELATIKDGPRTSQNEQFGNGANDDYIWWDMKFDAGGTGWVAVVNNFKLYIPPVEPPQPPQQTECEKEVERLTQENRGLAGALATSQEALRVSGERVEFLEATIAVRDKELADLEGDYDRILEERNRFESERLELQQKLDELESGSNSIIKKIADIIYKLFRIGRDGE